MRAICLVLAGLLALATASSGKKVVCYFGGWSIYRPGNGRFNIAKIDPNLCTHLIYTFVGLGADGSVRILDPWADLSRDYGLDGYTKFNKMKQYNPNLKTLIALGGWNEGDQNSKYSQVMASPSLRSNLVLSVVQFLEKHNFDGFDFDWEYPGPARNGGRPQDKQNLVLFLKELKAAFEPKGFLLSSAVSASINTAKTAYDIAEISKYLDFINFMAYDFHGAWESKTGHNGPLYAGSWESDKTFNAHSAIQYWLEQGAPAEKIIMGIPLYGRSWTLANPDNHGVNAPTNGKGRAGPYTREPSSLGYNEICEKIDQWNVVFDEEQRVPYAYSGNQWVSYDDKRSIAEKGEYVKKYGLGGMMIWSLETDDFHGNCGESWPLLKAVNKAVAGSDSSEVAMTPPEPNPSETPKELPTSTPAPVTQPKVVEPNNENPSKSVTPQEVPTSTPAPVEPKHTETPTVENNKAAVVCEGYGYLRNPNDCNKFYQCQFDGKSYVPIEMSCGSSLVFDTNLNICNFPYNVHCK